MSEICMDTNIYLHVPGIYRPFCIYLSFTQVRVGRTRFLGLGGEVKVVIDLGLRIFSIQERRMLDIRVLKSGEDESSR